MVEKTVEFTAPILQGHLAGYRHDSTAKPVSVKLTKTIRKKHHGEWTLNNDHCMLQCYTIIILCALAV